MANHVISAIEEMGLTDDPKTPAGTKSPGPGLRTADATPQKG